MWNTQKKNDSRTINSGLFWRRLWKVSRMVTFSGLGGTRSLICIKPLSISGNPTSIITSAAIK